MTIGSKLSIAIWSAVAAAGVSWMLYAKAIEKDRQITQVCATDVLSTPSDDTQGTVAEIAQCVANNEDMSVSELKKKLWLENLSTPTYKGQN